MPEFETIVFYAAILAALGSGIIGGVFFAFSTSVMRALDRMPAPSAAAAMQHINIAIINPWFLGVFLGTAIACLALTVSSLVRWGAPGFLYIFAGSIIYFAGSFGVTILLNVPLNNKLAAADPASAGAAELWADYRANWTFWNHIRAAASVLASVSFTLALTSLER